MVNLQVENVEHPTHFHHILLDIQHLVHMTALPDINYSSQ